MDENEKQEVAENGEKYEESGDKKKKDPNRDSSVDMEETTERLVSAGEKKSSEKFGYSSVVFSNDSTQARHLLLSTLAAESRLSFQIS